MLGKFLDPKSDDELLRYERETKRELDVQAILHQQRIEGIEEGMAKGRVEGKIEGIAEGLEKGRAEGKKDALLIVAKQMLDQGLKIKEVMHFTGLSEEAIDSIEEPHHLTPS